MLHSVGRSAEGSVGFAGRMVKPVNRLLAMAMLVSILFVLFSVTLLPNSVVAKSKSAPEGEDAVTAFLLKETGHKNLLKVKNIDKRISPASLTKIMTCMIAIESGRLDEVVTIPFEATQVEPTKAGFKSGDRFRLRDLVKAAMVNSSNDAAFALAVHLGGSLQSFVARMNARARALGMKRTVFTNPAGYDHGVYAGNRSTARDLMTLTEHAIGYAEFNEIAKLDKVTFRELKSGKRYHLGTHNKLLERYSYSVGIKTGYTSKAGPCLIARAVRDGKDMLVIMLHAKTDRWELASSMFEQGFGRHADSGKPTVRVASLSVGEKSTASTRELRSSSVQPAATTTVLSPEMVYARRAEALEALRQKVARQTAERKAAARKESPEDSAEKAGGQSRHEAGKNGVSLSGPQASLSNG